MRPRDLRLLLSGDEVRQQHGERDDQRRDERVQTEALIDGRQVRLHEQGAQHLVVQPHRFEADDVPVFESISVGLHFRGEAGSRATPSG